EVGVEKKLKIIFWLSLSLSPCNSSALYNVVAFLQIFSTVTYGASIVFWYAYLPTLTRHHPIVVAARQDSNLNPKEVAAVAEHMGNAISGHGFAMGYAGGIVALVIGALILIFMGQATYNMQIAIAFGGVWWGLFTIFTISWTKPRPGPPLPAGESYLFYSWKRVFHTISQARRLAETFKFLISWFLLSDGVNTVFYIALFYAKKEVGMTNSELIIAALIIPVCAIAGVYIFNGIQRLFHVPTKTMILVVSACYCILPIWGLIGFLTPNFGLKSKGEIYAASALDGLLLGPLQSFCRVLFSELLPAGHENEFFALYEITDKGSSWLGPLVIGAINSAGYTLRTGFWWVFATLITPVFITIFVNVEKGKKEAHQFSEVEKKKASIGDGNHA
ncbi:autophagy-related protein 22-like protein, partial [Endogone sp. FLAS-F59071]